MLNAIIKPLFLKENITWDDFSYPPVLAWLLLVVLGVLVGLDPNMSAQMPLPLWLAVAFGVVLMLASYPIITLFIRWWMGRKGCDGKGRMFRLIMAVSAIGIPATLLTIAGIPPLFTLPLWLYSLWVAAHALEQVCDISIGYVIGGILLSFIPAILVSGFVGAVFAGVAGALGLLPMPEMPIQ